MVQPAFRKPAVASRLAIFCLIVAFVDNSTIASYFSEATMGAVAVDFPTSMLNMQHKRRL